MQPRLAPTIYWPAEQINWFFAAISIIVLFVCSWLGLQVATPQDILGISWGHLGDFSFFFWLPFVGAYLRSFFHKFIAQLCNSDQKWRKSAQTIFLGLAWLQLQGVHKGPADYVQVWFEPIFDKNTSLMFMKWQKNSGAKTSSLRQLSRR